MKSIVKPFFFLFLVGFAASAQAQTAARTTDQVIAAVNAKLQKARDYSVDANIVSEIPMLKIAPVQAKIYFKQKDKIKLESKSIIALPKQGLINLPVLLADASSYTAVTAGKESLSGVATEIVNIIPSSDTSDVVIAKLWVDTARDIVLKSSTTTRSNGTVIVEYQYKNQVQYGLPDKLIFTIDVKKFKIPKGLAADINNSNKADPNAPTPKTGKIHISLSNYAVNKGINDSFFK